MRKFNRCEGAAGFAAICRGLSAASLLALTFSAPGEAVGAKDQFKGVSAEVEDDVAGIAGAISHHTGNHPPPLDGSRWEWKGEVTGDDVWGRKVESGAPYLTSSGIGHIVNGQGRYNGQSYASIPLLLGTNDLNSWDSYPRPVLEYADWQLEGWANTIASGGNKWGRVSPHALVYDDENSQFVLYFQSRQELHNGPPGIRSVGLATSKDMINWTHQDEVWYTVDDWIDDFSELLDESDHSSLYSASYPRVVGAWKHDGYYYIIMNGNKSTGQGISSTRRIMRSKHATRGFKPYPIDRSGMVPYAPPVEYGGTWYLPWRIGSKVGIYTSERLEGPYEDFVELFELHPPYPGRERASGFNLFRWNGKWCITYYLRPPGERGVHMWGMEK